MENNTRFNPIPDVRKKDQDAIDHAREVREKAAELRKKKAERSPRAVCQ